MLEKPVSAVIRAAVADLSEQLRNEVLMVDCERLAARVGKRQWRDPRL